jgi:drug/metabolite transporter (DMT)-like permease
MSTVPTSRSNLRRGYSIAVASAAILILSTTAPLIRHLTQVYHLPPLVLAFWRDTFVTLTLLPILGLCRPSLLSPGRQHLVYLVLYGLLLAIFDSLWTMSVALTGAAIATVLVCSSTALTALLGWWILKERLDGAKLLAVALSLTGCVLVTGLPSPVAGRANLLGVIAATLSGLGYAIYSLMGRSASQRGLNPWTTVFCTFGFASVFLLIFSLLPGISLPGAAAHPAELLWLGDALTGWGILFLLAAGPSVAGFGLYNVSLSYLASSVVNLIATSEPAFTAVSAYFPQSDLAGRAALTG